MNKTIPLFVEAIKAIPRQFYSSVADEVVSENVYDRFVSQLIVRYRKIAGSYCKTERFLPYSDIFQNFSFASENKAMIKKIAMGIHSEKEVKFTLFMEQATDLPLTSANVIVEVKINSKLPRGLFYWDLFKLNFLVNQSRCSCGIYLIVNQDLPSIQKKINAYLKHGYFISQRADNIFFFIKKDYNANLIVLNYKGDRLDTNVDKCVLE